MSLARWLKEAPAELPLLRLGGSGRPLELGVQRRMEAVFGRDLGEVRIHDTRQAGELANRLQAEAFTIGPRVFAAPDRLAGETSPGQALLAHELTHVIQQTRPGLALVRPRPLANPLPDAAPGLTSPTSAGHAASEPSPATPLLQLAAEVPSVEPDAQEAEAQAVEQSVAAMAERQEETAQPALDPNEVADRVYRLMRGDLRLERERRAF